MRTCESMHLLLIAKDTSTYIDRSYSYLEQALAKRIQLSVWRKSGHIQSIIATLPKPPDFIILIHDIGSRFEPRITGLSTIDIPSAMFVNDVHRFTEARRSFLRRNKTTFLFSVSKQACLDIYPECHSRFYWFPPSIHPDIYKDYHLNKKTELLMMGATGLDYPFRQHVINMFTDKPEFVYLSHPGYSFGPDEEAHYIGRSYAMQLNQAKLFLTCPSRYNYPVKKYFEALACKTTLLAPHLKELEEIGFRPGVHFVPVDHSTVEEAVSYYLRHREQRERIADQGFSFIHHTHTVEIRVNQLIKTMMDVRRSI